MSHILSAGKCLIFFVSIAISFDTIIILQTNVYLTVIITMNDTLDEKYRLLLAKLLVPELDRIKKESGSDVLHSNIGGFFRESRERKNIVTQRVNHAKGETLWREFKYLMGVLWLVDMTVLLWVSRYWNGNIRCRD